VKRASCPSCGAPVTFRSATSIYVVCEFCRSTLLRSGEDLQNLGRMAELLEDRSLIQIGSEGYYRNRHFLVIGRIQLRYEAGIWNEWHILFDDGRTAWLAEAGGELVVSAQVAVSDPLPAFETLQPEMSVSLDGRVFTVTNLATARCISGQGELPFRVAAGYDVNTADLRGNDRFLTLDYSETPPLVFVGQAVAFSDLKLEKLKELGEPAAGGAPQVGARAFNCPHCAAPLKIHSAAIESVACDGCGSIIGVENENVKLLARAAQALREVPWLPLGSQGTLHGIDWEVIGFMRRSTTSQGTQYPWSEYLLFNVQQGFAWLIEYQGHWNFARTLSSPPPVSRGQAKFKRDGQEFKLFNTGKAEVTYVVGEFYWRVVVGETCAVDDYVCPPLMLSREVTDKEAGWSQAEYLEPAELCAAFRIQAPPPKRIGVYANQPNPLAERHRRVCRLFWQLALAATVVQLAFAFLFASQLVLRQRLVLSPLNDEATLTSQEFVLNSRARALLVRHGTSLVNNWVSLSTTLVEKTTGESYLGVQEISHYKGIDEGESWSEGSPSEEMVFKAVPPGNYYLVIEYELGTDNAEALVDTLEVVRNPTGWSNFLLLLIFLAVFPLVSRWRRNAFEARRWSESDLGGGQDDGEAD
jgi:ribosomal protein S27E